MADVQDVAGGPKARSCGTWIAHLRYLKESRAYAARYLQSQKLITAYLNRNRDAGLRDGVAIIPVVVHVVYNTAAQNITDAQVQSQITVLNQDYRALNADISGTPSAFSPLEGDARIQFALAVRNPSCRATTGITRTHTTRTSFDIFNTDDPKSAATGGHDPWPTDKYLNIWVCPTPSNQLGRATFPAAAGTSVDGVLCNVLAFGNTGPLFTNFALGRTATHEIGHYFDLHHLWGDSGGCGDTDFVADTPTQQTDNTGCPAFPHVSCSNGPNGDMFMNFMDYVNDPCMFMFSAGQVARMEAALVGVRASLLASDGLVPPPSPDLPTLWSADSPADVGDAPDTTSPTMCQSDDIWVRNANDGITNQEHQNPISGQPNYVYVRVRNRSCGSAGSGTLKLYWAKNSTALGWPAPWDGSVTSPALMGGLIGSQGTGMIAGRGSTILTFTWSPPNPADYASFGGDRNHFCLLARTETSSTPPYGMDSPEGPNLWTNVQANRRIVWKNLEVDSGSGGRVAAFTIGNFDRKKKQFAISVRLPALEHFTLNDVALVLRFDPQLAKRLVAEGVKLRKDGTLPLTKLGQVIGPFTIDPRTHFTVDLQLTSRAKTPRAAVVYALDVAQYVEQAGTLVRIGGQRLLFKLHGKPPQQVKQALLGEWTHSHEEDADGVEVLRPAGHDFPPSRGRRGLMLGDDGSAVAVDIAAADGHDRVEAFWHAEDETHLTVGFADPERPRRHYEIVDADEGVLRLRRLS